MRNSNLIKFSKIVGGLKRLKRTGWVLNNIDNPETVAEHSFRLAILVMILAPKLGVDQLKAIKMALIHDIGEAKIGDIVIYDGEKILNDPNIKIKNERKALAKILSLIDTEHYIELFDEFEQQHTLEAKLVKQLDKLEMAIQALEYEQKTAQSLESFFINTRLAISDNYLKGILKYTESLRERVKNNKKTWKGG